MAEFYDFPDSVLYVMKGTDHAAVEQVLRSADLEFVVQECSDNDKPAVTPLFVNRDGRFGGLRNIESYAVWRKLSHENKPSPCNTCSK